MANRYQYQFGGNLKGKMTNIEGFVSIGTGGLLNAPPAYPVFPIATGATGVAGQSGPPLNLMPGQATAGVPTGWGGGGFSGVQGLIGAGVKGIARVATGLYAIGLEDDWVALDSVQVNPYAGGTGATGIDSWLLNHTVGLGNSIATGGYTLPLAPGNNPKNMLWLQFHSLGTPADIVAGGGFHLQIRVRDTLSGVH